MQITANPPGQRTSVLHRALEVVATVMAKMTILFELDPEMVISVIREQDESPWSYMW
ncbi:unnamed protein product [Rhodiola kirilowii]